jgi:hypothetical protein
LLFVLGLLRFFLLLGHETGHIFLSWHEGTLFTRTS